MDKHPIQTIFEEYPVVYKYLDIQGAMLMLQKDNLQFSRACDLNDPFECYEHLFDFHNLTHLQKKNTIKSIRSLSENIGYSSFTTRANNLLMWSYYNQHRGVCIGLLPNICTSPIVQQRAFSMRKITYNQRIPKIKYIEKTSFSIIEHLFCNKAIEWKHEEEIRMMTTLNPEELDQGYKLLMKIGTGSFTEIYFGCKINTSDKYAILSLLRNKYPRISTFQMEKDENAYEVFPVPINLS